VLDKLAKIIPQISAVPHLGKLDEAAVTAAHEQSAITSIRLNWLKNTKSLANLEAVPWCTNGRYLPERPVFTLDPLFHAGAYYVQEASSMFIAHAFESLIQRGENALRVLDLCAAPGGKSTLLAGLLLDEDLLIANEVIQTRASILAENLTRWGQLNTWVTNNDPKDFGKLDGYFDLMLIDAPCTGSGLWRKDAEAINEWSIEHVKLCADRQKRIVADAIPSLKANGILLYATCSYSAEENENMVDWIIDNLGLESVNINTDPEWNIEHTKSDIHKAAGYRFYPWKLKGEGFFLAAFKNTVADSEIPYNQPKRNKQKGRAKPNTSKGEKNEELRWKQWLNCEYEAIKKNEEFYALHPQHKEDYTLLQDKLRIKKTGTALGKIVGKDVIPDHELALSVHLSTDITSIDVTKEEALQFMKREEIRKENETKGWQVVRYEGLGLGWGKWLPNRMNNYFPKHWRIRMDIK